MSATVQIRPAVFPADLDAIMAIDRESFTNPWSREMFEWESANSDVARVFVAELDTGAVVAYCATWLIFDELHINALAVALAWRRQGLARSLLQTSFALTAQEGARRATLEVRAENVAALGLYKGLGFHVRGVRRGYYQKPPDDALILWRESLETSVPPA